MSLEKTGESTRQPGRPQKRVDPASGPLPFLAQALRDLREACGNPKYGTLENYARIPRERLAEAARGERRPSWRTVDGYAHVPHKRLAEAARGDQLPSWLVVEGYVRGCWAYYQHKHENQPPLDGEGDLACWQQLYRHAKASIAAENQRRSTDEKQILTPSPAGGQATSARPALPRIRRVLSAPSRSNRRHLAVGAGITGAALLIGGVMLGTSTGSGSPTPATGSRAAPDAPTSPDTGISVATPAPACGRAASDGFRSPAATPFSNKKSVYTLSLEGLAANLMEGTYNGISYDWVEAHPTGSRAGFQLRWANARSKWHYCTATLQAGNISALPDLVATMAVPATIDGRRVIYQACIWHQHLYTAQCSPLEL